MDRLTAMGAFRKVVEAQGFSAAARALGLSNAAVSKQVRQLEEHLGTPLLQRTTRQVSLTDAGRAYYERCAEILDEIEATENAVRDRHATAQGRIRLNAPVDFATCHLGPLLSAFLDEHPQVDLDVALSDHLIDPIAGGFDLTIRLALTQPDSSLIRHRLGTDALYLVASPAYLERVGTPHAVEDLAAHDYLAYSVHRTPSQLRIHPPGADEEIALRMRPRLQADNGLLLAQAAREGLGLAILPGFLVGTDLETGALTRVLTDHGFGQLDIAAISAPGRRLSTAVRHLIDHISRSLRPLRGSLSAGER